jgi:hypothetical protein
MQFGRHSAALGIEGDSENGDSPLLISKRHFEHLLAFHLSIPELSANTTKVHSAAFLHSDNTVCMTTFLEAIRRRNMGVGMAWELSRAKEWTLA